MFILLTIATAELKRRYEQVMWCVLSIPSCLHVLVVLRIIPLHPYYMILLKLVLQILLVLHIVLLLHLVLVPIHIASTTRMTSK